MKKSLLFLSVFFTCSIAFGQVGVNTENPQGVFHIDAARNTNGNTNISDDVVVDTQGRVGVGTNVPQTKVDIRSATQGGGFRLQDGSQGDGKVLLSDASGNASWGNLIPGTSAGTKPSTNMTLSRSFEYLGMYVTVPPGKSQVYVGGMVRAANAPGYITTRLSVSNTSLSTINISQIPGLAGFTVHTGTSVGQVSFFINNTDSVQKTLYLWGAIAGDTSTATWILSGVAEPFIFVAY
ncbi:hypothetical protein [Dysgonomonas sp. 520]|uniref:hypothetical protein n=1 Tax=Dysgonomonas sp. 520 TaxID=2302931 RepID=UPI0013D65864|nr:hypothetical protein [Dysgonomonas sp. 520]